MSVLFFCRKNYRFKFFAEKNNKFLKLKMYVYCDKL